MKAAFVQLGQAIDFVPSHDVAAGEILVCNGMAGVARLPVKAGELGSLHLSGVYDIDKAPGAIGVGAKVYFDAGSGLATTAAGAGNAYLGVASCNSPDGAAKVRVILNFGHPGGGGGCGGSPNDIQWQSMP